MALGSLFTLDQVAEKERDCMYQYGTEPEYFLYPWQYRHCTVRDLLTVLSHPQMAQGVHKKQALTNQDIQGCRG